MEAPSVKPYPLAILASGNSSESWVHISGAMGEPPWLMYRSAPALTSSGYRGCSLKSQYMAVTIGREAILSSIRTSMAWSALKVDNTTELEPSSALLIKVWSVVTWKNGVTISCLMSSGRSPVL